MKKTSAAVAAALFLATASHAGSLADPKIEPAVVVEDTTASSSGLMLVALLSILMAIPAFAN